jgi:predicted house-cleaning noncanonical NTP pyrophosphatase (MazG superfamily)
MQIVYTEEEIQDLFNSLNWATELRIKDGPIRTAHIQIAARGSGAAIWHWCTEKEIRGLLKEIRVSEPSELEEFLQTTPLEEVPLYLNVYSELAKWRLSIAK